MGHSTRIHTAVTDDILCGPNWELYRWVLFRFICGSHRIQIIVVRVRSRGRGGREAAAATKAAGVTWPWVGLEARREPYARPDVLLIWVRVRIYEYVYDTEYCTRYLLFRDRILHVSWEKKDTHTPTQEGGERGNCQLANTDSTKKVQTTTSNWTNDFNMHVRTSILFEPTLLPRGQINTAATYSSSSSSYRLPNTMNRSMRQQQWPQHQSICNHQAGAILPSQTEEIISNHHHPWWSCIPGDPNRILLPFT